jgi:hypothetical protein
MIIGICGTHGTGKSTILQSAKSAGCKVDETQLSRTVQKRLGWESLSKVEESVDTMWAFQNEILIALYDRDQKILNEGIPTIVERTPADVWAYTALWCKRFGFYAPDDRFIQDKELYVFLSLCRDLSSNYLKFIVVPPADSIKFEQDKNRADEESRTFVEKAIDAFLWSGALPTHVMKTESREARAAEIQALYTLCKVENLIKNKESY